MIAVELEQGTEAWFTEKLGKPSASNFCKIITNSGKPSKQSVGYMYELAAERITGQKANGYTNGFMEEGHAREQESRDLLSMMIGAEIKTTWVVYKDDSKKVLCSPDGLVVGRDEGAELKNPLPKTQVKYLLEENLPEEYFAQVQGSLYITGFKVWHFLSYSPCMKPLHIQVKRDEKFISALHEELEKFCAELDTITEKIR